MATINALNTGTGVAGEVMTSNGEGNAPSFQALSVDLTSEVTGILPEANGGTGTGTYTTGDILYSDAANSLTTLGIGSEGEVLKVTAGVPAWQTDSQGGFTTIIQNSNVTLAAGNRYVFTNAAQLIATLPATCAVGDEFELIASNTGGGGWSIIQNAGQSITVGNVTTTTGAGGSASSNAVGDRLKIVCVVANTEFIHAGFEGNLTIV